MTQKSIRQFFEKQVGILQGSTYPETVSVAIFSIATLYIGPNKLYLLGLLILLSVLFLQTKSLFKSIWFAFMGTLVSINGMQLIQVVLYGNEWSGGYDLTFTKGFLFNDVLLILLVYVLISRRKCIEKSVQSLRVVRFIVMILLCFIFVAFISTLNSSFPSVSLYYFIQVVKLVLIFLVSLLAFSDVDLRKRTLQVVLWFVILNSFLIIAQKHNGGPLGLVVEDRSAAYGWYADENPELYRPGGLFSDPNLAATLIACTLPYIIIQLFSLKTTNKHPMLLVVTIILGTALLFTASRSAWIISLISILIITRVYFSLEQIRQFVKEKQKYFVVSILVIAPMIFSRAVTLVGALGEAGGGTYRLEHLKVGLHYLFTELFGIGPGVFMYRMAVDFPFNESGLRPALPHNIVAQVGAELGILGLVLFLMFCSLVIVIQYKTWRTSHSDEVLAGLLALTVFLTLAQLFPWFLNPRTASWFWILSAIVVSSQLATRDNTKRPRSIRNAHKYEAK